MSLTPMAILFRIYGVTTSWKFENDALAYYRTHIREYLCNSWSDTNLLVLIEELREQTERDRDSLGKRNTALPRIVTTSEDPAVVQDSVVKYIEARRTSKPNKEASPSTKKHLPALIILRSLIISSGLDSKHLKAHIFKDVKPAFRQWHGRKIKLFSMSSTPAAGQIIFFKHTIEGDLSEFLEGGISTTNPQLSSSKTEPSDYKIIAETIIEEPVDKVLFLTDRFDEAEAAIKAEMLVILVVRDGKLGHLPYSTVKHRVRDYTVVSSFAHILIG